MLPTPNSVPTCILGSITLVTSLLPSAREEESLLIDAATQAAILAEGRYQSQVQNHLWILCKQIGPRLTASKGLDRAYEWTRDRFEQYGLDARIEAYDEWAVGFERGPARGGMVAPEAVEYTFNTAAWMRGTEGPARGPAVHYPRNAEELEAVQSKLKGAWLVERPRARGEERPPNEVREAVAQAGSLGNLRRGRSGGLLHTGGRPPRSMDSISDALNVTLLDEDFDDLADRMEQGQAVELEFDIQVEFRPGPIELCNVIADLPGTDLADEFVIVQGHLDTWDGSEGAQDNGTGVATTLEAARILTEVGARPRRTIRFILYSGEEQGLYGSRAYVEEHPDEVQNTSIVLNHDQGSNYLRGIHATPPMVADFERVFAPVRDLDPDRTFEIVELEGLRRGGSSDHSPFVRAGVPAFHWIQDGEGYSYIHHTQNDNFALAKADDQRHSSLVVALAALGFANLDHKIDRTDMVPPGDRLMGVQLAGTSIARVTDDGRAKAAGWQAGDVVTHIDGVAVEGRSELVAMVQAGNARKTFTLRRGDETLETVIDWSDDPDEPDRKRWRERRAAREQAAEQE